MATNAAMVLAKEAKAKPRDLAEQIADRLRADALIAKVDVAGPGFINLTLKTPVWVAALRAAITEIHPHLRDIELVNYKVRILDESHGTGAVTRVLIDASDGQDVWGAASTCPRIVEPLRTVASILTTIAMAALGLGVDVRKVAQAGLRVTAAVTASLIVLGLISFALIRIAGIG